MAVPCASCGFSNEPGEEFCRGWAAPLTVGSRPPPAEGIEHIECPIQGAQIVWSAVAVALGRTPPDWLRHRRIGPATLGRA